MGPADFGVAPCGSLLSRNVHFPQFEPAILRVAPTDSVDLKRERCGSRLVELVSPAAQWRISVTVSRGILRLHLEERRRGHNIVDNRNSRRRAGTRSGGKRQRV